MKKNNYQSIMTGCKVLGILACGLWLLSSCVSIAPVNSSFESTKILPKGQIECMGNYSTYYYNNSDGTENVNNNFGLRVGYGFNDRFDLKLRYERLNPAQEGEDININYFAISPRFSLKKDRITGAVDLGKYIYSVDNEGSESSTFISPRIAFGNSSGKNFDITLTTKIDIFPDDDETLWGINLGCGFSSDLNKWAIRPEIGLMKDLSNFSDYTFFNVGVALILKFNARKSAPKP